jgi:hypothetical protein
MAHRKQQKQQNEATIKQEAVQIAALKRSAMTLFVMGETPLIVQAWSQKARFEMLKKHMQIKLDVREAKNPYDHFLRSMYRTDDGTYGFPVVGLKEAMATATIGLQGVAKTDIYRNIAVTGKRGTQYAAFADLKVPQELAEVFSPNPPAMREDMVRLSGMSRTPDLRYRAEYWPWAVRFTIGFFPDFIDAENILNLVHHSGVRVGIGEWRVEKGGNSGAFHVADANEAKTIERWIKAGQQEPEPVDVAAWIQAHSVRADKEDVASVVAAVPRKGKRKNRGNGADAVLDRYN